MTLVWFVIWLIACIARKFVTSDVRTGPPGFDCVKRALRWQNRVVGYFHAGH